MFDQTRQEGRNQQTLQLDESEYADDIEMLHIVHRLTAAAAEAKALMAEKDEQVRKSVQALLAAGMPTEAVAKMLDMSIEAVNAMK